MISPKFSTEVSKVSDCYSFKSDYGNEFFLNFILPSLEKEFLNCGKCFDSTKIIKKHSPKLFENVTEYLLYICFFVPITLIVTYMLIFYLLIFKKGKSVGLQQSRPLIICRTKAALSKIVGQSNKTKSNLLLDTLSLNVSGYSSIYNLNAKNYIKIIFSVFRATLKDLKLFKEDLRYFSDIKLRLRLYKYYIFRLPYKVIYSLFLECLFKEFTPSQFISGNKEDRFAIIEKRLCNKYSIPSVCIPHGLEYGFRMPKGLFGHLFYCNSSEAKDILTNIYNFSGENEFLFDHDIVKNMFAENGLNKGSPFKNKMVFFPESRETEINQLILKEISLLGIDIYIKLHPSDRFDNYSQYIGMEFVIKDLDLALNETICLARRSTVLLESLYRYGTPCAILFFEKDSLYVNSVFPSLSNSGIRSVTSIEQLKCFIEENT